MLFLSGKGCLRMVSQLRGSFSNLWTNFQCMKMALYLTGPQNYGFPTMAISNWNVITSLNKMSSTLSKFYLLRMLHLWWYILSLPICINMAFSGLILKLYLSTHCLDIIDCVFSYNHTYKVCLVRRFESLKVHF